jgi:hypothetical protein
MGDMGCVGVPMEFRRNMQALELGGIIESVVRDPSAKSCVAAASLLGNR